MTYHWGYLNLYSNSVIFVVNAEVPDIISILSHVSLVSFDIVLILSNFPSITLQFPLDLSYGHHILRNGIVLLLDASFYAIKGILVLFQCHTIVVERILILANCHHIVTN